MNAMLTRLREERAELRTTLQSTLDHLNGMRLEPALIQTPCQEAEVDVGKVESFDVEQIRLFSTRSVTIFLVLSLLLVVVLNALIGFAQEYRAGKAIQALAHLVSEPATVRRDGRWVVAGRRGLRRLARTAHAPPRRASRRVVKPDA